MKFDKFILILILAVTIYAIFLFLSDFKLVYEKIINFKIIFLPIILSLVSINWFILFYRWHLLLKNSNIYIPIKKNFMIYRIFLIEKETSLRGINR